MSDIESDIDTEWQSITKAAGEGDLNAINTMTRGLGRLVDLQAARITELEAELSKAPTPPKGEPMPQTIEAWQRLYGLAEQAMERDKAEISRLKQKLSKAKSDGIREALKNVPSWTSDKCNLSPLNNMCPALGQLQIVTVHHLLSYARKLLPPLPKSPE